MAAGANALTQVLQGEARYDLVMRYLPEYRTTKEAVENIRLLSPTGERVSLAQLCKIEERDGGSEIYREGNQRYVAIKYSVLRLLREYAASHGFIIVQEFVDAETSKVADGDGFIRMVR